jgi:PAS domain S-box-containing protein
MPGGGDAMLEAPQERAVRASGLASVLEAWTGRWAGPVGLAVVVGLAYFLAARLSLALLTKPDGVAVFWPAAGVSSGVLIALGPRARWPVIFGATAATVVANLLGDRNIWSTVVFAACNVGEALIVAGLIELYFGSPFGLDRLRNVLGLLVAAIAGAAVSGVGGTFGYVMFHHSPTPPLTIWSHWFTSDALGVITVAPLLIGLASVARAPPPRTEVVEGLAVLVTLTLLNVLLILLPREIWAVVALTASLVPLLVWVAARCPPVFAAAAAFVTSFTSVWMTTFAIGILGDPGVSIAEHILSAQAGILAVSLCALVLAALFAERRHHEAIVVGSEERLQEALAAGGVTAFDWDLRTGLSRRSQNAADILGFDPQAPFTPRDFLARVHPDDRPRFNAHVRGVSPHSRSYAVTFRFLRPDGREVWLAETAKAEFDAAGRVVRVSGLTNDITERKAAELHQRRLTAELDHRVKNVLARVAVVAMQTREGSHSMDDYVKALNGRIQSMAAAHSLLSQYHWNAVGLADVVRGQLAPYATEANARISGPNIMLTVATTQVVAMVIHELVTNAAKYGALSTPGGQVSVSWNTPPNGGGTANLAMEWREIGGPRVTVPTQSGFGNSLISEIVPHELGGTAEHVFNSDGVYCRIGFPLEPA